MTAGDQSSQTACVTGGYDGRGKKATESTAPLTVDSRPQNWERSIYSIPHYCECVRAFVRARARA